MKPKKGRDLKQNTMQTFFLMCNKGYGTFQNKNNSNLHSAFGTNWDAFSTTLVNSHIAICKRHVNRKHQESTHLQLTLIKMLHSRCCKHTVLYFSLPPRHKHSFFSLHRFHLYDQKQGFNVVLTQVIVLTIFALGQSGKDSKAQAQEFLSVRKLHQAHNLNATNMPASSRNTHLT